MRDTEHVAIDRGLQGERRHRLWRVVSKRLGGPSDQRGDGGQRGLTVPGIIGLVRIGQRTAHALGVTAEVAGLREQRFDQRDTFAPGSFGHAGLHARFQILG
ncbi:MAG: hypothetical protein MUF48_22925 [Pirellulaceae bacterium]|nr:hypothetical protein [Pirellulaceae bacterium]